MTEAIRVDFTTTVAPEWIDYNDHMTEAAYLIVFGKATDALLSAVGADLAYVATGYSYYTVETHIRHLGQARLGEALTVETRLLGVDAKRLHLFHIMRGAGSSDPIATGEHMCVHVDAAAERASAAPEALQQAARRIMADQAHLPEPTGRGRHIAMPERGS